MDQMIVKCEHGLYGKSIFSVSAIRIDTKLPKLSSIRELLLLQTNQKRKNWQMARLYNNLNLFLNKFFFLIKKTNK